MNSRIRSAQKLFWAVLLVGTSINVHGMPGESSSTNGAEDTDQAVMQEPRDIEEAGMQLKEAAKSGKLRVVAYLTLLPQ